MKLVEITVQEWNELNFNSEHYFVNGCVFEESTDNLVAFGYYEDAYHEAGKYYKVVKDGKENCRSFEDADNDRLNCI